GFVPAVARQHHLDALTTDTPALTSGKTVFGYLSCPEISGLGGNNVKVTLLTNLYSVSFSAELKVDAFEAGNYYTFPLTLSEWKAKLGDAFSLKERPSLTALSFTAANNSGKILAKKLTYSVTGYEGTLIDTRDGKTSYTTAASATTKTMDIASGAIYGCIPYLFDRNLFPTMTYTSGAAVSYSTDGGGSFSDWDGKSEIDFSYGNVIRISKDGAYRDYEVQITNTGLPVVVINQPGGNVTWSEVGESYWSKDSDFDNITGGTMTIYNADGTISLATCDAATRIRGNSTQSMPKKPFAVKLGAKASVLGMNKHKRWVLLANWKDRSLLRNDICLGIARKFAETPFPDGSDNGNGWQVDGRFVELVYNGVHVGNYYLCEQIKIDKNRLNISGEYDGSAVTDADAAKFGYLMEVDDNYDEVDKFVTRFGLPIMFKDELDAGGVLMANVRSHILDIEQKLYNGYKGSTSAFNEAFAEMNINSFVDQFLIYEFCMNSEFVHPKSVYLYQDGTGALHAGPVWDFDWQSFPSTEAIGGCLEELYQKIEKSEWDRDYTKSLLATPSFQGNSYWRSTVPSSFSTSGEYAPVWYPMLIKSTEFQNLCAARWSQMKPILEAYASQIPEHGAMLEKSWEENNSFWPSFDATLGKRPGGQTGFCGDEKAATYKEVYELLQKSYMTRLSGMGFVTSKSWPSFSITEK
ncbi:MAG: CotH kinase family protein, partial [Candidatus Cryptobacteroides sp.]